MDRFNELADRIKAAAQERKEKEKCAKFKEVKLEGSSTIQTGFTKQGKQVMFEACTGLSIQSRYGVGTLSVKEGDEWKVIFTKGYPSKALAWMMKN
ncbi:hypothetical protein [Paenibacillus elgii]|uniref:hypothetical protein n=1 Tax=Paenibacillus elgii TaxID=189691 RepID=UPI000248C7D6|nr:hypothetical protein [Paenibacillus elgii]